MVSPAPNTNWGGKRKGAGRKPHGVPDNVTIYEAKDAHTLERVRDFGTSPQPTV